MSGKRESETGRLDKSETLGILWVEIEATARGAGLVKLVTLVKLWYCCVVPPTGQQHLQ